MIELLQVKMTVTCISMNYHYKDRVGLVHMDIIIISSEVSCSQLDIFEKLPICH
jgi:hypothetical protein